MDFIHVIFITLTLISSTLAFRDPKGYFSYDLHRVDTRSARRYCGSDITKTLTFLCESYNKRSSFSNNERIGGMYHEFWINDPEHYLLEQDNDMDGEEERPRYTLALVKLLRNPSELRYYRRQIRGVVDDCCKRSCTTNQCMTRFTIDYKKLLIVLISN